MAGKKVPLISIQYVSKSYDDNPLDYSHLVLKNVSADIYDGEFVIIFGPSGSGKSSLLNLMAGLEKPTAGRMMIRRRDMSHFTQAELARYHRLKMGMVFQSFNLIKSLNVWENVALPQTANGIGVKARRRRALRLLKLLGLEEYPDRHANELSGGEQQRVAIARSLINNPYFLLVDEPTGNLDSKSAAEVMKIFYGLNKHGKHTIVMVTHNPEQLQFASRVIYVQDGNIVKDETREQVEQETQELPVKQEHLEELSNYKTHLDENGHPQEAGPTPPGEQVPPVAAPTHISQIPIREEGTDHVSAVSASITNPALAVTPAAAVPVSTMAPSSAVPAAPAQSEASVAPATVTPVVAAPPAEPQSSAVPATPLVESSAVPAPVAVSLPPSPTPLVSNPEQPTAPTAQPTTATATEPAHPAAHRTSHPRKKSIFHGIAAWTKKHFKHRRSRKKTVKETPHENT